MLNEDFVDYKDENWTGYTLEELRYQRAMILARIEMEKQGIVHGFQHAKESIPLISGGRKGLVGKLLGSLSYIDYALLAFRAVRSVSKLFHRHK